MGKRKTYTKSQQGSRNRAEGHAWERKVMQLLCEGGVPSVRRTQYRGEEKDGPDVHVNAAISGGVISPAIRSSDGRAVSYAVECKYRKALSSPIIAHRVNSGVSVAVKVPSIGIFVAVSMADFIELQQRRVA